MSQSMPVCSSSMLPLPGRNLRLAYAGSRLKFVFSDFVAVVSSFSRVLYFSGGVAAPASSRAIHDSLRQSPSCILL